MLATGLGCQVGRSGKNPCPGEWKPSSFRALTTRQVLDGPLPSLVLTHQPASYITHQGQRGAGKGTTQDTHRAQVRRGKPFLCGGLTPQLSGLSPTLVLALVAGLTQDKGTLLLQGQLCLLLRETGPGGGGRLAEPCPLALGNASSFHALTVLLDPHRWLHPEVAAWLCQDSSERKDLPSVGQEGSFSPVSCLQAEARRRGNDQSKSTE